MGTDHETTGGVSQPGMTGGHSSTTPVHVPLSVLLRELILSGTPDEPLTMNRLLNRTEGRGVYLLIILICLPFLQPLPLLGLSTPMGLIMMTLALRQAFGKPPRLPSRLGDRPLPESFKERILVGSVKVLQRMERWVRPRKDRWLSSRLSILINCGLVAVLAFLLCLPLPPILPFTNTVPAIAMVLLSLSLMEEDGVLIWFGYAAVLGNVAFFGSMVLSFGAIVRYWKEIWEMVQSWP